MAYAKSRTADQKPGNLKFCAPFNEITSIGLNVVGIIKMREKSRLSRKLKVSTLDIEIKRSELRVSNSKVPSSNIISLREKLRKYYKEQC